MIVRLQKYCHPFLRPRNFDWKHKVACYKVRNGQHKIFTTMKEKIAPYFYLRADKVNKFGKMPLYIRFPRINGDEPKFSMGKVHFSSDEWNYETNLPNDDFWKTELEKEILRINRAINRCYEDSIEITKAKLREIAKDKKEGENNSAKVPKPETALFVDYYIECIDKKLKNGQIKDSTYKSHLTTINALREFKSNLKIKDISADTLNRFVEYLKDRSRAKGKSGEGTVINRLSQIKSVIRYVEALGIPIKNPFKTNDIYIFRSLIGVKYISMLRNFTE